MTTFRESLGTWRALKPIAATLTDLGAVAAGIANLVDIGRVAERQEAAHRERESRMSLAIQERLATTLNEIRQLLLDGGLQQAKSVGSGLDIVNLVHDLLPYPDGRARSSTGNTVTIAIPGPARVSFRTGWGMVAYDNGTFVAVASHVLFAPSRSMYGSGHRVLWQDARRIRGDAISAEKELTELASGWKVSLSGALDDFRRRATEILGGGGAP